MNLHKHLTKAPQKELMAVLGVSRPIISEIQNAKRTLSEEQERILNEYFLSLEDAETMRINLPQKHLEKFKQVFLYLLQRVGAKPNVGQSVLYKLLYFIDFDYYEKHEKQLMGLTYIKNTFGPTPREFKKVVDAMISEGLVDEVITKHFQHTEKKYLPVVEPNLSRLSGDEMSMINSVLDRYSSKSASQLSQLSHEDTPWQMAEDQENIEYEYAFYRPDRLSVREYSSL